MLSASERGVCVVKCGLHYGPFTYWPQHRQLRGDRV